MLKRFKYVPILVCVALLCGCDGDAEKTPETGKAIFLEVRWPAEGVSVKYELLPDQAARNATTDELERRVDEMRAANDRDALLESVGEAAGMSDAAEKIDMYESETVAVELTAGYASRFSPHPEGKFLVPVPAGERVGCVISHRFTAHPVRLEVRDTVSVEEREKLENGLKEMHVFSLRLACEVWGYFTGGTEQEALESAVELVMAYARVGLKKSEPLIADCPTGS